MYFGLGCRTGFNVNSQSYVEFEGDQLTEVCLKDMKFLTGEIKVRKLDQH